jgi:hypothetical protein
LGPKSSWASNRVSVRWVRMRLIRGLTLCNRHRFHNWVTLIHSPIPHLPRPLPIFFNLPSTSSSFCPSKFCTFDTTNSVLLVGGREVPTLDVTAGSCSDQISLSADCSARITTSSYLDGGDLLVDLRLLVAEACVE